MVPVAINLPIQKPPAAARIAEKKTPSAGYSASTAAHRCRATPPNSIAGNTISKMVDTREDLPLVSLLDMVFKILLMTSPGQDKIWMAGLDLGLVDRLEDTVLTAFLPLRE